jgi:hypothetical protein
MKLVAHQLPVRTVPGKAHAVDEHGYQAVHFGIGGNLNKLPLVAGGVPNFDLDFTHRKASKPMNIRVHRHMLKRNSFWFVGDKYSHPRFILRGRVIRSNSIAWQARGIGVK